MTDKQAEALMLAKTLYEEGQDNPNDYRWQAAYVLESLHSRVVELEAELVKEASRTASQKMRADQMSLQHDTQAALNRDARSAISGLQKLKDDWKWRALEAESQLEAIGAGGVESLRKKGNA